MEHRACACARRTDPEEMEHRPYRPVLSTGQARMPTLPKACRSTWLSLPECGFFLNAGGRNGAQGLRLCAQDRPGGNGAQALPASALYRAGRNAYPT